MSNSEARLSTEKEILMAIRNEALLNKVNAEISIIVIERATPVNDEHKKTLEENLTKYKGNLERYNNLLAILDERITEEFEKEKADGVTEPETT